jgi:hypothetical protein
MDCFDKCFDRWFAGDCREHKKMHRMLQMYKRLVERQKKALQTLQRRIVVQRVLHENTVKKVMAWHKWRLYVSRVNADRHCAALMRGISAADARRCAEWTSL